MLQLIAGRASAVFGCNHTNDALRIRANEGSLGNDPISFAAPDTAAPDTVGEFLPAGRTTSIRTSRSAMPPELAGIVV